MKKYNLKDAMKSALDSFYIDIDSGFDILHLDPSINIYGQVSGDEILDRLLELYSACEDYAFKTKKVIEYEIGTEEQMTYFNDKTEYVKLLNQVLNACKSNKWKLPLFVVTQVGTKVIEMQNIGILNQNNNEKVFSYVSELAQECLNHNFFMKVHNTDYLKHEALRLFPKYKISAANVAPEFGVCETKSLINFLEKYNLPQFINEFLNISYNSNKWEKWLMPNSTLTNRDKAIIAGHYVFSTDEFLILKDKIQKQIKNVNLDDYLKNKVKDCILTYLKLFRVNNTLEEELICTR